MRPWPLAAAVLLALAPAARADDPDGPSASPQADGLPLAAEPAPEPSQAQPALDAPRRRWSQTPRFGISMGGGFPDLVTADVLFRVTPNIRVFAGPSWGYVAWGMNAGVLFEPWPGWVSPTLSLEVGQLFQADASFLVKDSSGNAGQAMKPLLQRVDYAYGAVDLGLELGSSNGFAFFVRVGLSYVGLKANGTGSYTSDSGTKVTLSDPSLRGTFPSVKTGFQYFF